MSKSNEELVTGALEFLRKEHPDYEYEDPNQVVHPNQVVINELFNYDAYSTEPPRLMFFVDGILFYKSSGTSNKTPIFSDTYLPCFGILPNGYGNSKDKKIYYTINGTKPFEKDNDKDVRNLAGLIIKKTLPISKNRTLTGFRKLWACIINQAFDECGIIGKYDFRKAENAIKQIKVKAPGSPEYKRDYESIFIYICFSWFYIMLL